MNWKDLSVHQFKSIKQLNPIEFNSFFEYKRELMSICFDQDLSIIDELDIDEFDIKAKSLDFIFTENDTLSFTLPSERNKSFITISSETESHTFHFFDNFNYLTLAEWLDLEFYIVNDYYNNFTKALTLLYRLKIEKNSVLFPDEFEPYGLYARHRANLFDEQKIEDVYGAVRKFINWREDLLQKYNGLFKGPGDSGNDADLTDTEKEMLSETEKKLVKAEIEKEKRLTKWNVELFLKRISDNDPTKVEELLKMNVIFILNWMSADIETNGAN